MLFMASVPIERARERENGLDRGWKMGGECRDYACGLWRFGRGIVVACSDRLNLGYIGESLCGCGDA